MEDLDRVIMTDLIVKMRLVADILQDFSENFERIENTLIEFEKAHSEHDQFITETTIKSNIKSGEALAKQGQYHHFIYQRFRELEKSFKGFLAWHNEQKEYKQGYKREYKYE